MESRRGECERLLEALHETDAIMSRRGYERGELIYAEGEEAGSLYVLEEGVVKLCGEYAAHAGPRRATLGLIGPREVFGSPAFAGDLRRVSAEAFTGCEVVKIPRPFLKRAVRERREAAFALVAVLELALEEQQELVGCLVPRETIARLARLLPVLAERFGDTGEGRPEVGLRLTRQDLAEMVCATRESVSHAIKVLREQGLIGMENGRVTILDPEGLDGIGR